MDQQEYLPYGQAGAFAFEKRGPGSGGARPGAGRPRGPNYRPPWAKKKHDAHVRAWRREKAHRAKEARFSPSCACACGKPLKIFASSGRVAKACSKECYPTTRDGQRQRIKKPEPPRCADCGVSVWRGTTRCKACNAAHILAKSPHRFTCEHCGKAAHRVPGGNNLRNGSGNRWCSMACKVAWSAERRAPPFSAVYLNTCKQCGKIWAHKRKKSICSDACVRARAKAKNPIIAVRTCKWCAASYQPRSGGGRPIEFCCAACLKASKDEHKRTARRRRRKIRGPDNYRKRARSLGVAYEPVKAIIVFERDGWRCQICGKDTPKARRGTCYSNAPELDHRVPMSKLGPHTYANTQCACRACNGWKSNKLDVGQLPLLNQ